MRTIKFRIWNPEDKKMVESGATPMMLHSFFEYTARFNTQYEMPYQQFTGLLSKDGKEIYEGDIMASEKWSSPLIMVWDEEEALFGSRNIGYGSAKKFYGNCEVIGNIYENPELLN